MMTPRALKHGCIFSSSCSSRGGERAVHGTAESTGLGKVTGSDRQSSGAIYARLFFLSPLSPSLSGVIAHLRSKRSFVRIWSDSTRARHQHRRGEAKKRFDPPAVGHPGYNQTKKKKKKKVTVVSGMDATPVPVLFFPSPLPLSLPLGKGGSLTCAV